MEKIKMYGSIPRFSNAIIEEKLDGSNFAFVRKDDGLHCYSRKVELDIVNSDKFWLKFISFVKEVNNKIELPLNLMFFGEALGMAHLSYFGKDMGLKKTKDKLYIFDIQDIESKNFLYRKTMEQVCDTYGLNVIPLTTEDETQSKIDSNIHREGIIYRFEKDKVFKVKKPEHKYFKKDRKMDE